MKKAEVYLRYQNLISEPPVQPQALYSQSCSNDKPTIQSWRPIWISQAAENKKRFGSFKDHGIGKLFGKYQHKPVILAGSGPSLKLNADKLQDRGDLGLVSCLHNFHFLEDSGARPDFYVTLDAGPVTIEEVHEGGKRSPDEYWELTKDRVLLAYIGTHPELLKKWKGEIYFFNCPVPDETVKSEINQIETFSQYVGTGGNVLGASLYISKGFFGASEIVFTGADFCFSYDDKFHAWDSKYDKNLGHCVALTDVYGIRRLTWQSYANFKAWFDYIALTVHGTWINATEGGCLGSYPTGNLNCFRYMDLVDVLKVYNMNSHIKAQAEFPEKDNNVILF